MGFLKLLKCSIKLLYAHFKKQTIYLISKSDERYILFLILWPFPWFSTFCFIVYDFVSSLSNFVR